MKIIKRENGVSKDEINKDKRSSFLPSLCRQPLSRGSIPSFPPRDILQNPFFQSDFLLFLFSMTCKYFYQACHTDPNLSKVFHEQRNEHHEDCLNTDLIGDALKKHGLADKIKRKGRINVKETLDNLDPPLSEELKQQLIEIAYENKQHVLLIWLIKNSFFPLPTSLSYNIPWSINDKELLQYVQDKMKKGIWKSWLDTAISNTLCENRYNPELLEWLFSKIEGEPSSSFFNLYELAIQGYDTILEQVWKKQKSNPLFLLRNLLFKTVVMGNPFSTKIRQWLDPKIDWLSGQCKDRKLICQYYILNGDIPKLEKQWQELARNDQLEILQNITSAGLPEMLAAGSGHLAMLTWIFDEMKKHDLSLQSLSNNQKTAKFILKLIKHGGITMLSILDHGFIQSHFSQITSDRIFNLYKEVWHYLTKSGKIPTLEALWNKQIATYEANFPQKDILTLIFLKAAQFRRFLVMKWVWEKLADKDQSDVLTYVFKKKQTSAFHWALLNHDTLTIDSLWKQMRLDQRKLVLKNLKSLISLKSLLWEKAEKDRLEKLLSKQEQRYNETVQQFSAIISHTIQLGENYDHDTLDQQIKSIESWIHTFSSFLNENIDCLDFIAGKLQDKTFIPKFQDIIERIISKSCVGQIGESIFKLLLNEILNQEKSFEKISLPLHLLEFEHFFLKQILNKTPMIDYAPNFTAFFEDKFVNTKIALDLYKGLKSCFLEFLEQQQNKLHLPTLTEDFAKEFISAISDLFNKIEENWGDLDNILVDFSVLLENVFCENKEIRQAFNAIAKKNRNDQDDWKEKTEDVSTDQPSSMLFFSPLPSTQPTHSFLGNAFTNQPVF